MGEKLVLEVLFAARRRTLPLFKRCLTGAGLLPSHQIHRCTVSTPSLPESHRIVGVGRDLCGSSSPTLLLKQGHLQQAAQDPVQAGLEYLCCGLVSGYGLKSVTLNHAMTWRTVREHSRLGRCGLLDELRFLRGVMSTYDTDFFFLLIYLEQGRIRCPL